jgi:aminomethyltransferase
MNTTLRSTPLASVHRSLGAKMVPFAGWEMPVQYSTGILAEHRAVRKRLGSSPSVSFATIARASGPWTASIA